MYFSFLNMMIIMMLLGCILVCNAQPSVTTITSGLTYSYGLDIDKFGNLYTASFTNNNILQINSSTGSYITFASGSVFSNPQAITIDSTNTNLYVSNYGGGSSSSIAKVPIGNPTSATTFLGSSNVHDPRQTSFNPSYSYLYIPNFQYAFSNVIRVNMTTGTAAVFGTGFYSNPTAVAFWNNVLYVVSAGLNQIWKLDSTGTPTYWCSLSITYPGAMKFDFWGDLYLTEFGPNGGEGTRLSKVDPNGVETIVLSTLYGPTGLVFDANRDLFIVQWQGNIKKVILNSCVPNCTLSHQLCKGTVCTCIPGYAYCNGACQANATYFVNNNAHCGTCGNNCTLGKICLGTNCLCSSGTFNDNNNCGFCGIRCDATTSFGCVNGKCHCKPGYTGANCTQLIMYDNDPCKFNICSSNVCLNSSISSGYAQCKCVTINSQNGTTGAACQRNYYPGSNCELVNATDQSSLIVSTAYEFIIGYWKLDEPYYNTTGLFYDYSKYHRTVTLSGNNDSISYSNRLVNPPIVGINPSTRFDSYIIASSNDGLYDSSRYTLAVWLLPDWTTNNAFGNPCFISIRRNPLAATRFSIHIAQSYSGVYLWLGINYQLLYFPVDTAVTGCVANIVQKNWIHIGIVIDFIVTPPGYAQLYINGQQCGVNKPIVIASGYTDYHPTNLPLNIGSTSQPAGNTEAWIGRIFEFILWNTTLSPVQISQVYNTSFQILQAQQQVINLKTNCTCPAGRGGVNCEFMAHDYHLLSFQNHCYALSQLGGGFYDVETEAKSFGGHLASITSTAEQTFINSQFLSGPSPWYTGTLYSQAPSVGDNAILWIGLVRNTSTQFCSTPNTIHREPECWFWTSGESYGYANWSDNQPDRALGIQDFVVINYVNFQNEKGTWDDVQASGPMDQPHQLNGPYKGIIEFSCNNQGKCNIDPNADVGYNCTCNASYSGLFCHTIINNCVNHLCQNNATCTNVIGKDTYKCECVAGYNGTSCEFIINNCHGSNPNNPRCLNNGVCINIIGNGTYQCNCNETGYIGDQCEIPYTTCPPIYVLGGSSNCTSSVASNYPIHSICDILCPQGSFLPHLTSSTTLFTCLSTGYWSNIKNISYSLNTPGISGPGSIRCIPVTSTIIQPRLIEVNPVAIQTAKPTLVMIIGRNLNLIDQLIFNNISLVIISVSSTSIEATIPPLALMQDKLTPGFIAITLVTFESNNYNNNNKITCPAYPLVGQNIDPACLPSNAIPYYTEAAIIPNKFCSSASNNSCIDCPDNSICPGGNVIIPVPGYYSVNPSVPKVFECIDPTLEKCSGGKPNSPSACFDPYTGTMCSKCSDGYYELNSICLPCNGGNLELSILSVLVFGYFAFLGVSLIYCSDKWLEYVTIFVISTQQILSAGDGMFIRFSPRMRLAFNYLRPFKLDFAFLRTDCSGNNSLVSYTTRFGISVVVLVALFVWFSLFALIYQYRRQKLYIAKTRIFTGKAIVWLSWEWLKNPARPRLMRAFIFLIVITHLQFTSLCLTIINCGEYPIYEYNPDNTGTDTLRMRAEQSTVCYNKGAHLAAAIFSWMFIFAFSIALPIYFLLKLYYGYRNKLLDAKEFRKQYGFMYRRMQTHRFWFRSTNWIFSFISALQASVLPKDAYVQILVLLSIATIEAILIIKIQPMLTRIEHIQPLFIISCKYIGCALLFLSVKQNVAGGLLLIFGLSSIVYLLYLYRKWSLRDKQLELKNQAVNAGMIPGRLSSKYNLNLQSNPNNNQQIGARDARDVEEEQDDEDDYDNNNFQPTEKINNINGSVGSVAHLKASAKTNAEIELHSPYNNNNQNAGHSNTSQNIANSHSSSTLPLLPIVPPKKPQSLSVFDIPNHNSHYNSSISQNQPSISAVHFHSSSIDYSNNNNKSNNNNHQSPPRFAPSNISRPAAPSFDIVRDTDPFYHITRPIQAQQQQQQLPNKL